MWGVWLLKLSVSHADTHCELTTWATTLPQNHKWGQLLKGTRETPSLHCRNIYPPNKLFLVSTSFMWLSFYFCLTLEFQLDDIVYPDHAPFLQIIWGVSCADRMNHSRLSGAAQSRAQVVASLQNPCPKDESQRFIFTQLWMVMGANRHMAVRLSGLCGKWGRKL